MKVLIMAFAMGLIASAGFSQKMRVETYPVHAISKEIVRLQLRNAVYVPSRITSGLDAPAAKPVTSVRRKSQEQTPTKVKRNGSTPPHVISKGVALMQMKRVNQED